MCQVPNQRPSPTLPPKKAILYHGTLAIRKWGINLAGPFQLGKGCMKHIIVAVDYFTKWVEVEPLATILAKVVTKFLWKKIIYQFGIPHIIIPDNKKQFDLEHYSGWCKEL